MKYIVSVIMILVAVSYYFIFVNFSSLAWVPVPLIVVLLFYLNANAALAWFVAILTGILVDVHFLFIGPVVLSMSGALSAMIFFEHTFLVKRTIWSMLFLTIIGSLAFSILTYLLAGLFHGFHAYSSPRIITNIFLMNVTSVACVVVLHITPRAVQFIWQRYAR